MICLDNTDTLEGGASVAAVVDYTVHGLVSNTFTVLADGQLSDTDPSVLYTAGAAISIVSITLVNTHSAAVTVNLYLDSANGGNPRHLIPEDVSLGIGSSLVFDGQRFTVMDTNGNIITSVNVNIATDSGSVTPASSFTIAGGEGVDTSASGTTVTVAGEIATDSNKGVASFSTDNFLVTAGVVTIKDGGVNVAEGGTGATTLTDHGILVGSGTDAITPLAVGTTGQILIGATGADPAWSSEIVVTATESTFGGNIVIPDAGYIGSASDTDAIQIEADGDVVLTQDLAVGGAITAVGDITAYYSSDIRLKQNIRPIVDATEKLMQISGVHFNWTQEHLDNSKAEDIPQVGVIAQELEAVLPEAVTTRQNGYKAVKYDNIIPLLIQAIKEQNARIEALEARRE